MIDPAIFPRLQALWAEADAAFRTDDAYVIDMAEESVKVYAQRMARRARREAAAQVAVRVVETVPVKSKPVETVPVKSKPVEMVDMKVDAVVATSDEARRERSRAQARQAYAEKMGAMTEDERRAWHRAKNGPRTERSRAEARERYAAQMAAMSPEERKAFHRAKNERAKAKRQGDVGGAA
ncbi:hypothetical protein DEU35_3054 [Microbacterium sp. AG157]|uniref:hypothetical protein n=1 Tax=Microbacterium sp. AG157 TaxID=2183993 RepID=UPI000E2501CF|nr:hypothetical protein [Microbacterium sp. AG157]REC97289.1 hypothetical protein DEU35_3054 [Microbacterium sp. AG157]